MSLLLLLGWQGTLLASPAQDAPVLILGPDFDYASAAESASYLMDDTGHLTLEAAQASSAWQPMRKRYTSFGFTHDTAWLRLTLHNAGPAQRFILRLEYPLLDHLAFYAPDAEGQYQQLNTGDQLPFSTRPIKDRHFAFAVDMAPGERKTLYWSANSQDTLIVPLTIATQDEFENQQLDSMLVFGMYYGAILVILFINSFLFFYLRQRAQLYYVALLANYALVELSLNGTGNLYLWGDMPQFTKFIRPFAIGLLSILTLKLTKAYFNVPRVRFYRYNVEPAALAVGLIAMAGAFLLPFSLSIQLSMLAMLIVTPFVLSIAFRQLFRDQKTAAMYYVAGWTVFLIGGVLNVMRAFDLIEVSFVTTYGSQIGSLFTLVILNMGLTDQFREGQRLNERSKELIIRQQERLNQELDHAVKERTQELEAQKHEAEKARSIAEQALATKSQFLATMSHEIRTPMNGVLGLTQMLMDTPLNAQQQHLVATIKHSGDTLVAIINDILDYSKIEAGKLHLERIEFDIRAALDECIELFASAAVEKGIRLLLTISPDTPTTIQGDPTRLRQIILNLLGNAIKFTDSGFVKISAHYDRHQNHFRLSVRDTGIGISHEQQQKLFQSFSQADSSTTRKFGGTGLGLAISKSLTALMNGYIGVKSTQGDGSEFWLEFPTQAMRYPDAHSVLRGKHILILDELEEGYRSLANALLTAGAHPLSAHDNTAPEDLDLIILHEDYPTPPPAAHCPILTLRTLDKAHNSGPLFIRDPFTYTQLMSVLVQQFTGQAQSPLADLQTQDYSHLRVLVAEDNPVNQMVVKGLLKKFNITPDLANDGLEAIFCVQQAASPYHLILMDCEMPNLDGYEATRQLQGLSQCEHTRIVGLSAHAMSEHREAGLNAGMAAFLTKPIAAETLGRELAITAQRREPN